MFATKSLNRSWPGFAVIVFSLALLVSGRIPAQTITGTISGSVVDSSGASVPAAKTVLLDEGTGSTRTSETNEAGIFTFDAVRPGTYTVKVEKQGFRAFERTHMVLGGERAPAGGHDRTTLGQTSETVTIQAQGELVKTDSAEHSGLLSASQIDLSIARGRDPINLLRLLPGASSMTGVQGGGENDEGASATARNRSAGVMGAGRRISPGSG